MLHLQSLIFKLVLQGTISPTRSVTISFNINGIFPKLLAGGATVSSVATRWFYLPLMDCSDLKWFIEHKVGKVMRVPRGHQTLGATAGSLLTQRHIVFCNGSDDLPWWLFICPGALQACRPRKRKSWIKYSTVVSSEVELHFFAHARFSHRGFIPS